MRRLNRQRKGATTLLELLLCTTMFTFLMTALISLSSQMNRWVYSAENTIAESRDIEYLTAAFLTDVKSSVDAHYEEERLTLIQPEGMVSYYMADNQLFRETESVIANVDSCRFSAEDMVMIEITLKNGKQIQLQCRL